MRKVLSLPRWQLYLLMAVLPPVCEELLCRGFLFASFRARFGDLRAVLFTAVLFGALHLDLQRIPATAIAGLALGYVRLRTGTILFPILFHMAYNATLFDLATEGILQDLASRFGIAAHDEHRLLDRPPLLAVAAAAAALAGAAVWLRLAEPRNDAKAPDATDVQAR